MGLNLAVELADAGILEKYGVRCLGTPVQTIRSASDRELFKNLLQSIGEPVLESGTANGLEEARAIARRIGLPLIIRPSYTLGGTGGGMAGTWEAVEDICCRGLSASPIHQVLLENRGGWKKLDMRSCETPQITASYLQYGNLDPMGCIQVTV